LLIRLFLDVSFTVLSRIAEGDMSELPDAQSRLGATLAVLPREDVDGALLVAQSLESGPQKLAAVIAVVATVFEPETATAAKPEKLRSRKWRPRRIG
jgi:hypothetical protein